MKTISSSFVGLSKQPMFWLALILTLVAISILVNLGMWQLERAKQKSEMQKTLQSNQQQAAQSLNGLDIDSSTNVNGVSVTADLAPLANYYLLLDNQTYNGDVGYLALQLMRQSDGQHILLERGFISATLSRSVLPQVEWLTENYQGKGRLYTRSTNPLSDALMAENTTPLRIQNLNIAQLSEYWQLPIEAYVLQPLSSNWPYLQPWRPIPMSADKHTGYAVQWFAMAMALGLLTLIWLWRALKTTTKESL
ncbi:cytochrome oxidase biogenesis protein Surf1 facilitates heme A insertion [Vibrio ponticus]|uniref:SURF1-like protein n=1 Tax=Vibrio ponticus TaxID=265668 RepID=A0ABX3FN13_9VIBR|nr:SURF1 family protein [Vibrio ponticus]OLQ94202.1 cytochrome oxidase biogenesis protein Surf1 facilitates heme A insertion [Vibrio ponticus]